MRYHTISILTVFAAVAFASPLAAQSVQGGSTVRAMLTTGENEMLLGTLISRTADSLVMLPHGSEALVRLPSSSVRGIEVLNGKNRIRPAIRWGLIGAGVWGIVAAFVPFDDCTVRQVEFCSNSRAEFVAVQTAGMAIAAGAYGAYRGEDRWVRIEGPAPRVFVAPTARGVSAGVRVGF